MPYRMDANSPSMEASPIRQRDVTISPTWAGTRGGAVGGGDFARPQVNELLLLAAEEVLKGLVGDDGGDFSMATTAGEASDGMSMSSSDCTSVVSTMASFCTAGFRVLDVARRAIINLVAAGPSPSKGLDWGVPP